MSNLVALPAPEPQVNASAVELLEIALEKARSGEFVAVAIAAIAADTIYTAASSTPSNVVRHAILGAMAELQRRILQDD